jgi:hypothetical protein
MNLIFTSLNEYFVSIASVSWRWGVFDNHACMAVMPPCWIVGAEIDWQGVARQAQAHDPHLLSHS